MSTRQCICVYLIVVLQEWGGGEEKQLHLFLSLHTHGNTQRRMHTFHPHGIDTF